MDSNTQDRQLPASERKLRKARDEGQVARSRDLTHLAVLGTGVAALFILGPLFATVLHDLFVAQLRFASPLVHPDLASRALHELVIYALLGITLLGLLIHAGAILSALAMGGWVWSTKPLTPDFSRLHPVKGLQQLLSMRKLIDVAKICVITAMLCVVAYLFMQDHWLPMATLVLQPSHQALHQLMVWLAQGLGWVLLGLLGVAVADVPAQRFLHRADLKMSRQEVKDEHKESEGNQHTKGRLRQRQRELAQRRSITAVPRADFVVMNPSHFAVAVRYDEATMAAPRVVAMGVDVLAMKIRDLAQEHSVPVIQSPALARALYANSELGQSIPLALYSAVAQVLAYVYRLKAAQQGLGPQPGDLPELPVPAGLDPYTRAEPV